MRIAKNEMFHTPADMDYVMEWINRHNPDDRPHLITAMMMTWNYLADRVNDAPMPVAVIPRNRALVVIAE